MINDTLWGKIKCVDAEKLQALLKEIKPMDLVPVIRCRDCKHRPEKVEESDEYDMDTDLEFPDEVCPCQCDDYYYSWMPKDDWFCASGERK